MAYVLLFVGGATAKAVIGAAGLALLVGAEYLDHRKDMKAWREPEPRTLIEPLASPHSTDTELSDLEVSEEASAASQDEQDYLLGPTTRPSEPVTEGVGSASDPGLSLAVGGARLASKAIQRLLRLADREPPSLEAVRDSMQSALWSQRKEQATLGRYTSQLHEQVQRAVDDLRPYVSHAELDRLYQNPRNTGDLRMIATILRDLSDMAAPSSSAGAPPRYEGYNEGGRTNAMIGRDLLAFSRKFDQWLKDSLKPWPPEGMPPDTPMPAANAEHDRRVAEAFREDLKEEFTALYDEATSRGFLDESLEQLYSGPTSYSDGTTMVKRLKALAMQMVRGTG